MKKLWSIFLAIPIASVILASPTTQPQIKSFQGSVEIAEKSDTPAKPAQSGMPLSMSNMIITGAHSYCVIQMDENNLFRIKQNARLIVEKIWDESKKKDGTVVSEFRLNLMRGELLAKLDKLPPQSEFNVAGPVAIAGAAGTVYGVSVVPESNATSVTVLDHQVHVQSLDDPEKSVLVEKFQRVESSPWQQTTLQALGRGVLSEKILGKDFVKEAEQNVQIQSFGLGKTEEEAKLQSFLKLSRTVLQLRADEQRTLENVMAKDQALTQKVFSAIAKAKIIGTIKNPDGTFQVKSQIDLMSLENTLGQNLFGITQSVIPITLSEYSSKFGALARITTQRAAQVEGYRNLAEIIYGTIVNSNTTIEDFAVKNDTVRTTIQGFIKGAQIVESQYFSDGSIIVSMEIRGDVIPSQLGPVTGNVYGENYLSGPQIIEFDNFEDYLSLEQ